MGKHKTKLCGAVMPRAKNGASRGQCTRQPHSGAGHGNNTCSGCGVKLLKSTARPSIYLRGAGFCRLCTLQADRARHGGRKPFNTQHPGQFHTFSTCQCSGILPESGGENKLAARRHSGFMCRISRILGSSIQAAKEHKHKPVDPNTPHSVIRTLMDNPNCVRCGEPLDWSRIG